MAYYAVIDVGSNTIKLVIYKQHFNTKIRKIKNIKVHAHLIDELTEDGIMNATGIKKLLDALLEFQATVKKYNISWTALIGTAVMRRSKNIKTIQKVIMNQTGLNLRVLTGEEEAYYGHLAVLHSSSIKDALIVDVGGGSTEVTLMKNGVVEKSVSFSFGARSISSDEKSRCFYLKKEVLKCEWIDNVSLPLFAIGGSAHNVVKVIRNAAGQQKQSTHEYKISGEELVHLYRNLSELSKVELLQVDGLSENRVDTIVTALEIFITVYEAANASAFIHGRKGLREGLIYEYITARK